MRSFVCKPIFLQKKVVSKLQTSLIALSKLSTCLKQQRVFASKKERLLWWRVRACEVEWKRAQRTPHSTAAAPHCRTFRLVAAPAAQIVPVARYTHWRKWLQISLIHCFNLIKRWNPFLFWFYFFHKDSIPFFLLCPWKVFANFG